MKSRRLVVHAHGLFEESIRLNVRNVRVFISKSFSGIENNFPLNLYVREPVLSVAFSWLKSVCFLLFCFCSVIGIVLTPSPYAFSASFSQPRWWRPAYHARRVIERGRRRRRFERTDTHARGETDDAVKRTSGVPAVNFARALA